MEKPATAHAIICLTQNTCAVAIRINVIKRNWGRKRVNGGAVRLRREDDINVQVY